jgi:hypothetical protein
VAGVNRGRPSSGLSAAAYTKGLKADPGRRRALIARLNWLVA